MSFRTSRAAWERTRPTADEARQRLRLLEQIQITGRYRRPRRPRSHWFAAVVVAALLAALLWSYWPYIWSARG